MKRVYRVKIGVGTLVCSQERRALFVPLVKRWSTADFVPPSVLNTNLTVRSSGETFKRVFSIRWRARARLSSCRIEPTASRPIQPRAASLPRRAPPRTDPPVVCPGFGFDRSNYRGAGKCGVGAKSGPKGASCSGRARHRKLQRDDYRHITRPSTCTIIPRHTAAGGLEDDPSSAGPLLAA